MKIILKKPDSEVVIYLISLLLGLIVGVSVSVYGSPSPTKNDILLMLVAFILVEIIILIFILFGKEVKK